MQPLNFEITRKDDTGYSAIAKVDSSKELPLIEMKFPDGTFVALDKAIVCAGSIQKIIEVGKQKIENAEDAYYPVFTSGVITVEDLVQMYKSFILSVQGTAREMLNENPLKTKVGILDEIAKGGVNAQIVTSLFSYIVEEGK